MGVTLSGEELATLGIVIEAKGAISELRALDAEMKTVATSSGKLSGGVVGTIKPFAAMDAAAMSAKGTMAGLGTTIGVVATEAEVATPIMEGLGMAIGAATGTVLITAAIIGIQALVEWLGHLGDESKKAADEQTRLARALGTHFLPKTGPRSSTNLEFNAALAERARLTKELGDLESRQEHGELFLGGKVTRVKAELAAVQQAIADAYAGSVTQLDKVVVRAEKVKDHTREAAREAERYAAMMLKAYGPDAELRGPRSGWHANPQSMTDTERAALAKGMGLGVVPDAQMPVMAIRQQIAELEKARSDAERHAQVITGAIIESAQIIVSALNVGGGGRNSSLGGALGGTAGFAIGFLAGGGPVGGAIGSTIGQVLGSAIGGLFDSHKKAVNENTAAMRQLTQALLLNSPSGYKVASARFDATDVKDFRRAATRYATRGGAPILTAA